jgi:hypothetical protein
MAKQITDIADGEDVRQHLQRWAHRAVTRTRAHDPGRRPWDRQKFIAELQADDPLLEFVAVVELADRFERCVDRANGSSARLARLLDAEFAVP